MNINHNFFNLRNLIAGNHKKPAHQKKTFYSSEQLNSRTANDLNYSHKVSFFKLKLLPIVSDMEMPVFSVCNKFSVGVNTFEEQSTQKR